MSGQFEFGWLLISSGLVLSLGAFVLLALMRSEAARASMALAEFLGDFAGGVLLLALILEIFGFMQASHLFGLLPDQKIDAGWLILTLFVFVFPGYGIYRALNFPETVHLSSSRPTSVPLPTPILPPAPNKNISYEKVLATTPEETDSERPAIADEWQIKIMEVMKKQDGLSLVDLGKRLGVDWRQLTVAARQLVQDGKLRKEDKFYHKK
jgi:hypothetical protein